MNKEELIQHAIQSARIGERERARDFFLEVIDQDPENLTALAWLIDLLDDIEDRIYACEKVLESNPNNTKLQAKLQELIALRPPPLTDEIIPFDQPDALTLLDPVAGAEQMLLDGRRDEARKTLISYVKQDKQNERAWLLLSQAIDDEEKQIIALKHVLRLNPANIQARTRLDGIRHFRENPVDLAAKYEEEGKYEEALEVYRRAASEIQFGPQFDQVYGHILRLEKHKTSGVVYVKPDQSIARLTFGPPLLFFLLMLIHNQLNPFALTPLLWAGCLMTLGGGFLLAVANVRSRHPIWVKIFDDPGGGGSPLARTTLAVAGWMLIVIPFAFLFQNSYERLPLVATNHFLP